MPKPFFLTVSKPYFHKYKAKCFVLLCAILFATPSVSGQASDEDPAVCQKFQPPESKSGQLVDWLLRNGYEMKEQGCWQTYIQLGPQGMQEAAMHSRFQDRVRIALAVASIYFYQGDYDQSRKVAEEASNYAQEHEEWDGYIASLAHLSGVARAQGRDEAALGYTKKGMGVIEKHPPVDPYLKAKTLYNLGAFLSDSNKPDLGRARIALVRSLALYHHLKNHYEIVRTHLRLARIDYLEGHYDSALIVIESVKKLEALAGAESPRTRMLTHYMAAKVHHRLENWDTARAEVLKSLALSDRMNAREDGKRARALLAAIDNKTFVND
ncbi:tetratricopeptide repeat protein [Endozoicomonas sp. ALD040]|uniref:tetratricopeptide repeat protein n=1 Tax=unclassified Endozoicomonas TaxID=2644528 RepID=UPI003BAEAA8F